MVMNKHKLALFMLGLGLSLYSCKENITVDTPRIISYETVDVAYMGDSIPLSITTQGDYPLNTIKFTFFRNNERISETLLPVKAGGSYSQKLFVPFVKNIEDGNAEIQLMVSNKNFNYSTIIIPIQVTRPKYPYLTLKTAYGNYKMEPVAGQPYKYAVTDAFPVTNLNAIIEAPAYGANGNAFYFAGKTIAVTKSNLDSIPFQTDKKLGSIYTVSFDTRTFEGEPFLKPSFGEVEFPAFANNRAVIEHEFTQNQTIAFGGFLDIDKWWIDPTFLNKQTNGTYTFRAITGKYRVTADQSLKYFRIEPMDGNALANFNASTKSGGVWINGGVGDQAGSAPTERIGIPSMSSNPTLWNPEKNIAMAPLGNGIFQIKLIANQTMFLSNVTQSTVGIGFYMNSRSMDNPFALNLVQTLYGSPGAPEQSAGSARFELKPATASSKGQIIATGSNRSLGSGRTYVFTLDTKVTPAAVTISLE